MNDMFSRISEILSDPEAAQKIRQIAASLGNGMGGAASGADGAVPAADALPVLSEAADPGAGTENASGGGLSGEGLSRMLSSLQNGGNHSREMNLLNAVRPYLRASRADRVDNAIKAIRVIDMISGLR